MAHSEENNTTASRLRKRAKAFPEEPNTVPSSPTPLQSNLDNASKHVANRRKVGKLASLMELPMDVLFEIFGHLYPYDLLKLARVSKEFRRVLMKRSSITVWRQARSNVPCMPDCPTDMSEPAYASLVFSPHCHFCLRPSVRIVDWTFRVRMCGLCRKTHMGEADSWDQLNDTLLQLIPTRSIRRRRSTHVLYLKADYDRLKNMLRNLDSKQKAVFIERRKSALDARLQHALLCRDWARGVASSRMVDLARLKKERQDAIITKLQELGWGDEIAQIQSPDSLLDHPLVKQPHRLTNRIWTNIGGALVNYMESMRAKRLERERKQLINRRRSRIIDLFREYKTNRIPFIEVMPEPADYLDFEPIKTLLDDPSDDEISEDNLSLIRSQLNDLISQWRTQIHQDLAARVQDQNKVEINEATRIMKLATTAYRCEDCFKRCSTNWFSIEDYEDTGRYSKVEILFYPDILGHQCLTRRKRGWNDIVTCTQAIADFLQGSLLRHKLTFEQITVDDEYSRAMAPLIRKTGLNPKTATAEELDKLDPQFYCKSCREQMSTLSYEEIKLPYWNWREMVVHVVEKHQGATNYIGLIPASFLSALKNSTLEGQTSIANNENDQFEVEDIWFCSHCIDLPHEPTAHYLSWMFEHLRAKHAIDDPILNVDYYKVLDAAAHFPTPYPLFTYRRYIVAKARNLSLLDHQDIDFDGLLEFYLLE